MGLLSLGTPLDWQDTKKLADHVRDHGITQFLETWKKWEDVKKGKGFLWGDEVGSATPYDRSHHSKTITQITLVFLHSWNTW